MLPKLHSEILSFLTTLVLEFEEPSPEAKMWAAFIKLALLDEIAGRERIKKGWPVYDCHRTATAFLDGKLDNYDLALESISSCPEALHQKIQNFRRLGKNCLRYQYE